jgi:signal transduction histidine kinase
VIEADSAKLQRAIELLLAHELKATPPGGRIGIATTTTAACVELIISGTGGGVASADVPYVLDPFRRSTDGKPRSARGVERGLLLAQALIVAHGGTLSLASDGVGAGETFRIVLPRNGRPSAAAEK